ncbi:peptidoglycan editing factor PgeF [Methylibium sp.]|uniref:peptidoglycan editing factor PgeF n=1 Tax=Methylibium sp. TaxID=2067992 RepID=UPI003D0C089A
MSTRSGGVSEGVYASLNLGSAVGDDPQAVAENRARFAAALGATPVFLRQVHGVRAVRLPLAEVPDAPPEADASWTTEPGVACVIQVADCLPVLFAAPGARGVAGAHAGWRGLSAGVLEATVQALCEAAACAPGELEAWLGPCIGPRQFEVGADVLAGFGVAPHAAHPRFVPLPSGKWLADLPGLARDRLAALGLNRVSGGAWCTVEDASRFFSFRRDRPVHGNSGRMAAAVWIERS